MLPLQGRALCALAALAVGASPAVARAQRVPQEAYLVVGITVGPAALGAVICDLGNLYQVGTAGGVQRGFSITGLAFSGLTMLMSASMLLVTATASFRELFPPLAVSLAFGVASLALNLYGVFHPPPEGEASGDRNAPLAPGGPTGVQVFGEPVKFLPYFGVQADRRQAGIALSTTW